MQNNPAQYFGIFVRRIYPSLLSPRFSKLLCQFTNIKTEDIEQVILNTFLQVLSICSETQSNGKIQHVCFHQQ